MLCNSELRSFQKSLPGFDARGIRVAAISVDPPDVASKNCVKHGLTFTMLCDEKREVVRRYDLLHAGAGPGGSDIPRPAEFLLDSGGIVRWLKLTESVTARARPEEVLKAADQVMGSGGSASRLP